MVPIKHYANKKSDFFVDNYLLIGTLIISLIIFGILIYNMLKKKEGYQAGMALDKKILDRIGYIPDNIRNIIDAYITKDELVYSKPEVNKLMMDYIFSLPKDVQKPFYNFVYQRFVK